jgi:cysteine sulfinate desulfinase/cysteine desulfurase-like protein
MGLEDDAAASIRVSLGPGTTASEIEAFVGILVRVVERARAAAPVAAGARA